jgi:hypothetical protein
MSGHPQALSQVGVDLFELGLQFGVGILSVPQKVVHHKRIHFKPAEHWFLAGTEKQFSLYSGRLFSESILQRRT